MFTTPNSSSNNHSPSSAATADSSSPKFPPKDLHSPWSQVVRGADSEPLYQSPVSSSLDSGNSNADAPDSSDADKGNNAGIAKKHAWKTPSNGVAEVGTVMGAVSWPPLSESTKPSAKASTDDGSSISTPQEPVTPHSPKKHASSNVKHNPAMNHGMPNRQRLMRRGGGNSNSIRPALAQNSYSNPSPNLPPPPPPFPVLQIPPTTFANGVPGVPDLSPRDPYRNGNWDTRPPVGGFLPPMNEYRNPPPRGHFGHHPRGDGPFQNNYGGRRDQDRGNYANTRDTHVHQQRMPPRGLMRPSPHNPASFMGPPPLRPFSNPAGFPEYYYFPTLQLEHFGGMPFFTHGPPPAIFFPVAETPLTNMIVNQIDYYFSDDNLCKDEYLKSNMDEQGWVPVTLIAGFPRVRCLTSDISFILDSLRISTVVEVQGDRLRRRSDWMKWVSSAQLRGGSSSASRNESSSSSPVADFGNLTLEESTADKVHFEPTTNGESSI